MFIFCGIISVSWGLGFYFASLFPIYQKIPSDIQLIQHAGVVSCPTTLFVPLMNGGLEMALNEKDVQLTLGYSI